MTHQTTIDFFPTEYTAKDETPMETFSNVPSGNISSRYNDNNIESFEDEEPLWRELGFDPDFIKTKTIAILFKRRNLNELLLHDTDLGGPLVFCLLLGGALVLGGKIHFGYIFGYGLLGSLIMCLLLNLMTEQGIGFYHTASVLGYSLSPMILLALTSLVFPPTMVIGFLIAASLIAFCTYSASFMFSKVLSVTDEGFLFAYPIGLLYACFALIVMF